MTSIKQGIFKRRVKQTPLGVLLNEPRIGRMTDEQRVAMTTACRDTDYIKKVKDAGKTKVVKGKKVQILFNGLMVEENGYVGEWMTRIIKDLKGHHEPQEEKVFYEVLKRIKNPGTIIELGSYWSYYSLWFNKTIKNSRAICVEPDPNNRGLGERNAALNADKSIVFLGGAAGSADGEVVSIAMDSDPTKHVKVPIMSVDSLMKKHKIDQLDILHMDVQGFELDTLKGALQSIQAGRIRFVFVSTHHYLFSGSPVTHQECMSLVKENGGHIIASHTIPESFSGDGLIVASFFDEDKDFKVSTSSNHPGEALFRPYEEDIQILIDYYGSKGRKG